MKPQVYLQRNIPGFGCGKRESLTSIMRAVQEAQAGLELYYPPVAKQGFQQAAELFRAEYPRDSTLLTWLKIVEIDLLLQTHGVEVALERLNILKDEVDAVNPKSCPLFVDFTMSKAKLLSLTNQHFKAALLLKSILHRTKQIYGANHAVVRSLEYQIGVNLLRDGKHEEAVRHFRVAHLISKKIYPRESELAAQAVYDVATGHFHAGYFEESVRELEEYLSEVSDPPKSRHALMLAALGISYSRLDSREKARKLLEELLAQPNYTDSPLPLTPESVFLANYELGRIESADKNWIAATRYYRRAVTLSSPLMMEMSDEGAQIHLRLGMALKMQGRSAAAEAELRRADQILRAVGAEASPESQALREQLEATTVQSPSGTSEALRDSSQ